jgi:hypothetical protein
MKTTARSNSSRLAESSASEYQCGVHLIVVANLQKTRSTQARNQASVISPSSG